ncbi:hypothetical protein K5V21_03150 [Clostridium sardiniense]|uniref:Lipoprotein n=1 Tax=Clostridium sardiniense TaxID=29369 RepID=A0ABS7KUG0_CLOSR|nr:hypothetical protein [Clostridium sardiniense]MBY0754446.1 hypothetical protein [Clostridium sardiniense]MDQ0461323.1 putative membrane protein [Clostridium sardiniense]
MKHKKSSLLSILMVGILILVPMYLFVGCGNKDEDKQATNTQTTNTENAASQNTTKENQDVNKSEVKSNENNKKVVTAEEKNKNVKSESQVASKKEETKPSTSKFTPQDAINICEKKYGKDSDTIYASSENMKDVNGEKGYLVQVKSKELMKQGGNGVAFTVLVTPKGQIIEL